METIAEALNVIEMPKFDFISISNFFLRDEKQKIDRRSEQA